MNKSSNSYWFVGPFYGNSMLSPFLKELPSASPVDFQSIQDELIVEYRSIRFRCLNDTVPSGARLDYCFIFGVLPGSIIQTVAMTTSTLL